MAFISVQHGHGIQANDYETQSIRTGGERAWGYRMGPEFATFAHGKGKVVALDKDHVAVEYEDGETKSYQLGTIYNNSEGTTYNSDLKTTVKVGDVLTKDDNITYNAGFFAPSPFEKFKIDYLCGAVATIALREATYTLEDSSSVSVQLAKRLGTQSTVKIPVRMNFNQSVSDMVKVGQVVDINTILCTIEDGITTDNNLFDDETRESLRLLSAMTPEAKEAGTISKIEVIYNGNPEYMSESVASLVKKSESERKRLAKILGQPYVPNTITSNVMIAGNRILDEQLLIYFYIIKDTGIGNGDKLVFANQMKSTIGEVLMGETTTLDGQTVDSIFGAKSAIDRILTSPFKNGLVNSYTRLIGNQAFDMYFGD